jgi:hypothetical protein
MPSRLVLSVLISGLLAVLLLTGCAENSGPREDETTLDFRQISQAYEAVRSTRHRPPKDVAELKQVLQEFHDAKFGDPPDEVLTSNRDGLPYGIVFGLDLGAEVSNDIFIYEQKGADGMHYVMTMSRVVQQVPDAGFAQLAFARGHRPGSAGK